MMILESQSPSSCIILLGSRMTGDKENEISSFFQKRNANIAFYYFIKFIQMKFIARVQGFGSNWV
jgi:hypothetical protein